MFKKNSLVSQANETSMQMTTSIFEKLLICKQIQNKTHST